MASFKKQIPEYRELIDDSLNKILPASNQSSKELNLAMAYSVLNGGKRIRPLMMLASAKTLDIDIQEVIPFAASIELLHSFSLIHDDLPCMDDDSFRRGQPTTHINFKKNIRVTSVSKTNIRKFHQQIQKACTKDLVGSVFVDQKDFEAGKSFIDNAENGKFEEKIKNAINILRWVQGVNRKHKIERICWGYRKKPGNVMNNHPGDIFLQFKNKEWLGVSLKAGGEKTDEPKLNTYVKPIFEYFGKINDYEKIKDKLWPQYMEIEGIEEVDKRKWGKNDLALKTYAFEKSSKENETKYNELYDKNLGIIKEELINLIGKKANFSRAKDWIREKVAQQQQDVPLVIVKATAATAKRDKASDLLIEAVAAVKKITAQVGTKGGKQAFEVKLFDGTKVQMNFTTRTNKVGANHKMGQFTNLAVKFNKVIQI